MRAALSSTADPFGAGGAMAQRIYSYDWPNHPLGPMAAWQRSLKTIVRTLLNSQVAMWLGWGPELYFFCNDACLPIIGGNENSAIGESAPKLWTEIGLEIGLRAQDVLRAGRAAWDGALPLRVERNGQTQEISYFFSYSPVLDDNDAVGGVFCVAVENGIPESDQAHRALRESEERFARFMRHLPGSAWIKDIDGHYVYANESVLKNFRTTREELYKKTDKDFLPQSNFAGFRENDRLALLSEAGVQRMVQVERDNGAMQHMIVHKFPIPGSADNPTLIGGIAIDITEHKRAEEALRESEERFRLAIQTGKVGVWDWNIDRNRVLWTDSLYAIHGLKRGEFDGTVEAFTALVHPDDRQRVSTAIASALQEDIPYEHEFRLLRPDGKVIWIFTSATLVREQGRPMRMIGATVDITDRKQTEAALRESEERLRQQAKELEEQLIASGRLVSLGEVTASMAHEFNNPLGVILGFAQDLLSATDPSDADYRALEIIDEEARRCRRIVQGLMDLSRPQATELIPTRIDEVIKRTLSLVESSLFKQKIDLDTAVTPDLPKILADHQQLEQVLVNLLLNAIDAMPAGGKLAVTAKIEPKGGESAMVISVSDTGAGIDKELVSKIFLPFYTAGKKRGLGLGLSICGRIVKNHGGTIEVHSQIGAGTTFKIYLPLHHEAAAPSESAVST